MKQSNSKLLAYLSLLLSKDEVLTNFIIDPITEAEGIYGLTKAERAVLRRTVAHLSNKAKNGYTMARHLGSYRRSLRLLQNVLHNVGSKMVQDTMITTSNADEQLAGFNIFSIIYYYPTVDSSTDFTCQSNDDVNQYGGPYVNHTPAYPVILSNPHPTIQEVMDAVPAVPYTTVPLPNSDGVIEPYVKSITFPTSYEITADLSNDCYDLTTHPDADSVFWFWSVNGKANLSNSGGLGESFATRTLNSFDTVYWQLIAPDKDYGFYPCLLTEGNTYALTNSL